MLMQMVEAGWCYDPSQEAEDGVTCFYCNLSLDGWEPKDNPLDEHKRRSPDCSFFTLCEQYKAARPAKAKRGRTSTASKASRLSTQSIISTFSEAPSLMSLGDAATHTDVDETLAVDTTITSDAGTTKGRKKTTKAKAPAKARKKTKKEDVIEPEPVVEGVHDMDPEVEQEHEQAPDARPGAEHDLEQEPEPELIQEPAKPTRGRKLKRVDDSSIIEVDPPVKAKKSRAKPKKPETPQKRQSEDESQLQSELQDAASFTSALQSPPHEKGTKRTSDGMEKVQQIVEGAVEEAPTKQKRAGRPAKVRKGKKAAKETQEDGEMVTAIPEDSTDLATSQQEVKPKRGRKPKKAQQEEPQSEEPEQQLVEPDIVEVAERLDEVALQADVDMAEDEQTPVPEAGPEIQGDDETEDTATFQNPQDASEHLPTPAEDEFEPTPTPQKLPRSTNHIQSSVARPTPRRTTTDTLPESPQSIHSSDAENHRPSSSSTRGPTGTIKKATSASIPDFPAPPSSDHRPLSSAIEPRDWMSPAKTSRVPLAPGTPNRFPTRALQRSPSKHLLGQLTSSQPWEPVELETILFPSPEKDTPSKQLSDRLVAVGGVLTDPEKQMSVEEWVRWRAEQGEQRLRGECERMVGLFEKEGGRALDVLVGIRTDA